jgi:peptidoglycan/LPS O-acetylase OafA/YrhL
MAVNLIGLPSETSGGAHIASLVFLVAHVLIALGLILGAVMLLRARPLGTRACHKQAILGAAAISVTTAAGVLTLLAKSNWWSYAMAAGFITAILTYGSILAQPEPVTHGARRSPR